MLAPAIHWDSVGRSWLSIFCASAGAHALDAVGTRGARPWGEVFTRTQLWAFAIVSLVAAYSIGIWYMVRDTPLLWLIAIPEGFFLLAYNLEWFGGRFHRDSWFALSWGALPVLAGYVLQTNAISASAVLVALAMGFLSSVEIRASRPYKELKREWQRLARERRHADAPGRILKSLSAGVVALGVACFTFRPYGAERIPRRCKSRNRRRMKAR